MIKTNVQPLNIADYEDYRNGQRQRAHLGFERSRPHAGGRNRIVPFRARLFVEQHFLDGSTHRLCAGAVP